MRRSLLLPLAAAALVACETDWDNVNGLDEDSPTRIRVLHASPTAPILDAVLNFSLVAQTLTYTEASPYVGVEPNQHTFEFRKSIAPTLIDPTPLVRTHLTVEPFQRYTILAVDVFGDFAEDDREKLDSCNDSRGDVRKKSRAFADFRSREFVAFQCIEPLTLLDDPTAPPAGSTRIRFVDAAPSTALVDVYITAPGASLPASTPTFEDLTFKTVATYITLLAGTYRIRVTTAGTTTVLLDINPFIANAGLVLTLVMLDAPAGGGPSILRGLVDRP
ncbi:MAG: DUF4397 domain-containing protein [Longimicrobiales bacterium]